MPKKCCPFCFGDRGLTEQKFPELDRSSGRCSYCNTQGDDLALPIDLRDSFEFVAAAYEEDPGGEKTLTECLTQDWQIFDNPDLSLSEAKILLADIFDDGEMVRKSFKPSTDAGLKMVSDWDTLKDELRYKNRYFPDERLEKDRLNSLLAQLLSDPLSSDWYRARIMSGDELYSIDDMGAPPKELASHGRANPSGIPYLYLASNPVTCIAEVRPHTGELACVAEFIVDDTTKIVDLRNPRKLVSPFIPPELLDILQLRADLPFLEKLGAELTRPVLPRSAAIDYVPSQFLCEFIKKQGFSGVLYSSSLSDGMNLALFDVAGARARAVSKYSIDRVSVEVNQRE